jgi:oxygen-dependent protoporphyrinogen oxidase
VAQPNVVIVGGGVSGLSTAYFLGRAGIRSTIIEKSRRLGGLIRTDFIEGCQVEAGPDSYLAAKPAVTELAEEISGLKDQLIGSDDERRRIFVLRNGRLLPMPQGMVMMVPGKWLPLLRSPLFSPRAKLRFLRETFFAPRHRTADTPVSDFITDHFGKEVLEYAADPLLSGIYGGNAATLSAQSVLPRFMEYERNYGSLIRGVRRQAREASASTSIFLSFRAGMQTLTDSLAKAVADSTEVVQATAARIESATTGWLIHAGAERIHASHVVLACPAHVSADLLETAVPSLASELAEIPYSSAILVTLAYPRSRLPHSLAGFGFLVPTIERRTIAAATWVSSKFPSRAPPDLALLRAFVVDPIATRLLCTAEQEIVELVRKDFLAFLGLDAAPLFSAVHHWPRSMPQYVVDHEARIKRIRQALDAQPGLYLAGNAYQGVGIPDCVRLAKETANHIATDLRVQ